ncbi:MAG: sugar phosphate isomerase/epimerase, partial [Halioglobus sp.]
SVDGIVPFDYLLANTDVANVQFQLDLFWVNKVGQDPLHDFRDHGHRLNSCHMKDMAADGDFAEVGAGALDFQALPPCRGGCWGALLLRRA